MPTKVGIHDFSLTVRWKVVDADLRRRDGRARPMSQTLHCLVLVFRAVDAKSTTFETRITKAAGPRARQLLLVRRIALAGTSCPEVRRNCLSVGRAAPADRPSLSAD